MLDTYTKRFKYKDGMVDVAIHDIEQNGEQSIQKRYDRYIDILESKGYDVEDIGYVVSDLVEYCNHFPNTSRSIEDLMYGYHLIKDVDYYGKVTKYDTDELDYYYQQSEEYEGEFDMLAKDLKVLNEYLMLLYVICPGEELSIEKGVTFDRAIRDKIRRSDSISFSKYYIDTYKGKHYDLTSDYYSSIYNKNKSTETSKKKLKSRLNEYLLDLTMQKAKYFVELEDTGMNIVQIEKDEKYLAMYPSKFNHVYYVKKFREHKNLYTHIVEGKQLEEYKGIPPHENIIKKIMLTRCYKNTVLDLMAHLYARENGLKRGLIKTLPLHIEEEFYYERKQILMYVLAYQEYLRDFGEYHPTHKYIHLEAHKRD